MEEFKLSQKQICTYLVDFQELIIISKKYYTHNIYVVCCMMGPNISQRRRHIVVSVAATICLRDHFIDRCDANPTLRVKHKYQIVIKKTWY